MKNIKTKLIGLYVFMGMLLSGSLPAMAGGNDTGSINITPGLQTVSTSDLSSKIVHIATDVAGLAGAVGLFWLIYNGFRLMTDDERKRADAMQGIKWTLIAMVLIGLAITVIGYVCYAVMSA